MHIFKAGLDRRAFIGGSDARIIMGDDEGALERLWREKRGETEPEDLSGNLIVQLGSVTEELNRHWYERNTGQVVIEVQRQVFHPVKRWMAATIDGMVEGTGAVFEAKFMLPWTFSEEGAAAKHMAQLQHNMWVTASRTAVLSIITGGGKWVEMTVPADPLYQHLLLTAEKKFWRCVETGEAPHLFGVEPPRPRVEAVRMPAKNTLTADDARLVEEVFQAKFSAVGGPEADSSELAPSPDETAPSPEIPVAAEAQPAKIDKSVLAFPELRRHRDKTHLRFVAKQPCLICGRQPCDAHHLRFAQSRGLGIKVSDEFTVPLCRGHHRELHRAGNEATWWRTKGVDAMGAARKLWIETHPVRTSASATDPNLTTSYAAVTTAKTGLRGVPPSPAARPNDETKPIQIPLHQP